MSASFSWQVVPRRAAMAVVVAVAMAALGACSSGGNGGRGGSGRGGGDGDEQAIFFAVTDVRVESMAAQPGPFPEDVWAGAVNLMNAYLDRGLVRPLRLGTPPSDLEPLFTPAALARVTTADRTAMLDDGTVLSGPVTATRANTSLVLLTDRDNQPVVINAAVDVVLSVKSEQAGTVALARTGQVVLVKDEAGWRIDSYDLRSLRDSVP
ncbi:MAG: hypothetical protein ABIW46_07520 [Acidimicrobiales bacterium]